MWILLGLLVTFTCGGIVGYRKRKDIFKALKNMDGDDRAFGSLFLSFVFVLSVLLWPLTIV
jgi:hypothetical protein